MQLASLASPFLYTAAASTWRKQCVCAFSERLGSKALTLHLCSFVQH